MMFHTKRLSEREAKWVARAQARKGSPRAFRRFIQGVLTHRIVRDLNVPYGEGFTDGDIIQIHPSDEAYSAQGLFRVIVVAS